MKNNAEGKCSSYYGYHTARLRQWSTYWRVTGVTDTYVTVTGLPTSLQRFMPIQLQLLKRMITWNLSWSGLNHRSHNSISQIWLKVENLQHLERKDHIERLQQRRVQSISEASSRRLKNQALAPSFRTRAPRQTPTSTSSAPSLPSTASHLSSRASQQTSIW